MKGKITISRYSDGYIYITIEDELSRIEFAELKMGCADFGRAITGFASQPGELSVRGLEHVGKQRVNECREIECPLDTYDREELSKWLEENAQEEGWILNSYLGSQSSIMRHNNKVILKYSVTKFV